MSSWKQPVLKSNGTWGVDDFAVRGWNNDTYLAFDGTDNYLNGTNTDGYIEIWIKDGLALGEVSLASSDGYLPTRGIIAYSDDGESYTDCGTWSADNGNKTTVICTNHDVHKYFRLTFKSYCDYRSGNADISNVKFVDYVTSSSTTPVALNFDGSTNYAEIPVSLTDVSDWSAEIIFETDGDGDNDSDIYRANCLFGQDIKDSISDCRDFHVDVKNGNLHIYHTNENTSNYDELVDTKINVADGKQHTVKIVSNPSDNGISVFCDGVCAKTVYIRGTDKKTVYMPTPFLGWNENANNASHLHFSLYSFKLTKNGSVVAEYNPIAKDAVLKTLTDKSGNGNDAALYGNVYKTYEYEIPRDKYSFDFDASRFVKYTGRTAEYDTKIHKVLSVSYFLDTDRTIRKAIPVSIDYDTNRRVTYKYAQRLNGGDYVYNTGVRINDGKKHRIILRATGTKLELFCDGKKLPVEIPQGRGVCDSTTYLGAFPDGNSHTQFNLYGLQVFKRSLTDDELKKIPSDSLARFDKFDSDTKDRTSIPWTIYDESGNKNNMSLYWSFTKDFNPRVNVKDDYDTCVRSTIGVSSDSDLSRALYTDRLNVSDDYVAIRRMVSYEYVDNDALRKTSRGFSYEFSSIRRLAVPAIKEFDSLRTINNDHFTWQRKDFSTERELSSIPTSSYAVCECGGIDLDDVYTIIPYLDLHGTCRAQMRYGSDSYGEWEDYTAKKIDCRYIQFRILVNGYCNAAELKIVAPIQEETQVIDVKTSGTDVAFDNLYFKTPSIFPSYTGGTIEIKNITRHGCTVYLKNEDGAYIDGQVSLMIRG